MRKSHWVLVFLLIGGATTLFFFRQTQTVDSADQLPVSSFQSLHTGQVKAVHYFASAWPKTFWENFERSQVDRDFSRIREDGFNTVILVLPWRGFETGFGDGQPEASGLYERLDWLLTKIEKAGLTYGLRVSFPHNFNPDNQISTYQLCNDLFMDEGLREQWLAYLTRITGYVNQHRASFRLAFFSWEDFFCPYSTFPGLPLKKRLDLARSSGYQDWIEEHFPMTLVEFLYLQSFASISDVPIPENGSPANWLRLQFVDQFLIREFLEPGRRILPELAMEVRVDKDPVQIGERIYWAAHDLALSDNQLRGSYWGPSFGARNEGELLTAGQALGNFEYMLNEVSDGGKNPNHIVEQFNFVDNTPAFVGINAEIDTAELPEFLQGAADLLNEKSRGYGLWAYQDYADSALYNSSFELGIHGWTTHGDPEVVTDQAGDLALQLPAGSTLSQVFSPFDRFAGLGRSETLTFCANFTLSGENARLSLFIDDEEIGALDISESGRQCSDLDVQSIRKPEVTFSLSSDAQLQIDDLRLYAFVQKLDIYDETGQPGPIRDLIIKLNFDWLDD